MCNICGDNRFEIISKAKEDILKSTNECETWDKIEGITLDGYVDIGQYSLSIEQIKPYLFPLSSMTEEQEKEYNDLNCYEPGCFPSTEAALDYLIKNHFDYRFLIDEGLALDATELNIY